MSQRWSEYKRKEFDLYETPEWVTQIILKHLEPGLVWEPSCGNGKMVKVLQTEHQVKATDVQTGTDFLNTTLTDAENVVNIVTNPPYGLADRFIEHALVLMRENGLGLVAMLLRTDFDHAKTRKHLFENNDFFHAKIVLTKRIVWFEKKEKKANPSYNHAWFIWKTNRNVHLPPFIYYGPE